MAIMIAMTMKSPASQVSIADARDSLPALVHAVERGRKIELTRRGKKVAVLVSATEYERLTTARADLWSSLHRFRESHDLEGLRVEDAFADVRDRGRGRKHAW